MMGTFRLATWQEGAAGSGQGGLASYLLCRTVGQDLSVRLHAPIPLETDLTVHAGDDGRYTVTASNGGSAETSDERDATLILSGGPQEYVAQPTDTVGIADGRAARERTVLHAGVHTAPNCFSCGINERSMGVHPGALPDGRFATDLTPPSWTINDQGHVEPYVFWVALDCTAGVFVASVPEERVAVTANFQVKLHRRNIEPGPFVVVAHPIDEGWDGRKRWAGSAVFDGNGELVAEAISLWISLGTPAPG